MGIKFAIENIALAPLKYKNWAEVITSVVKRQEPAKVILKSGIHIEGIENLKYLVREVYLGKPYNPANLPLGCNDVVVDIGAHIGLFALFAASITRNMIYAFEPAPGNFECLQRNINANGLSNVIAHHCAVSDRIGSAKLFLNSTCGGQNVLFEHIIPAKVEKYKAAADIDYLNEGKRGGCVEVPTTTLQEIMDSNQLERIDFLKLDCEGSEGPILNSTPKEYLKRIRKIAMEFHDHLSQFNHDDIQKLLEVNGFITKLKWDHKSPLGYLYAWRD